MKVLTQVGILVRCEPPPATTIMSVSCHVREVLDRIISRMPSGRTFFMCFFHIFGRQVVGQVPLVHRLPLINPNLVTKLSVADFVGGI